jgi:hypothetical protein
MTEGEGSVPARPLRVAAVALWVLLIACFLPTFVVELRGGIDLEGLTIGMAFFALGSVGALVVLRQGNTVGWVLLADALCVWLSAAGVAWAEAGLPGAQIGQWLASWGWNAGLALIPIFFLLYPTGSPPSPRWRWVVAISGVDGGLLVFLSAFGQVEPGFDNPFAIPALVDIGLDMGPHLLAGFVVVAVVSVISLVVRFVRSGGIERRQIGWLLYAAAVFVVLVTTLDIVELPELVEGALYGMAYLLLPIAIGVAVFRYRLFEIDRIVNRTVTYAVVVGMLAAVYLGGVAAIGALVGEQGNSLTVAAATLAAAALFNPVRRAVQGWVDRRFSRSKYDAQRVVETFSARLRDEVELEAHAGDVGTVVQGALHPSSVSLWIAGER